jgi:hypothetical protein
VCGELELVQPKAITAINVQELVAVSWFANFATLLWLARGSNAPHYPHHVAVKGSPTNRPNSFTCSFCHSKEAFSLPYKALQVRRRPRARRQISGDVDISVSRGVRLFLFRGYSTLSTDQKTLCLEGECGQYQSSLHHLTYTQ